MTHNVNAGCMLAYDMGTGKTKPVIDYICSVETIRLVLIVCPKSVVANWPMEFDKDAAQAVTVLTLDQGSIAKRAERAALGVRLASARGEKLAIILNYEAAWRDPFATWALNQSWDMIVADECHRIKAPGGEASKFMGKLSARTPRRVGLTGTPMPHSPLDVYAQYRCLDPGVYGTSFTRFRGRYAVMGGYQGHQVLGFQHQQELHDKFYSIGHRVKKSDVLDLPPVIHERRGVDLEPTARRVYRDLEREMIADVEAGTVTVANALAKLLRLQQITSGHITTDDGESRDVSKAKQRAMYEIFEDLPYDEPVVVFCRFRRDLDMVAAMAEGRECYELSGRANDLARWQQASGGEVLAVQIQAGGLGIDLTRAAYCVFFSLGFNLGDYLQALARTDRPGQTRSVTYLHLLATETVDEKVHDALEKRADVVETILTGWKKPDPPGDL